ncbi:MAG: acyl-CoA dehydrogenase [Candidatus Eremiobacteraeota bacterium]|nr:acyl-CoA dehydrogenase [Candidatus Eremiobacteraeota bacterium]
MSAYRAPLRDMEFVVRELAGLAEVAALPGFGEAVDVASEVLEQAATFARDVLDPLNASGDREGCTWRDGVVTTPRGFKEAYRRFAEDGWIGLAVPETYGGGGLPQVLSGPVHEMWTAANLGFSNAPGLCQNAIETLELNASEDQKRLFIPKLISGEWTGTMDLTEPQAGSDLAAVRTRAVPDGDRYRLSGQKIFITYGEHDIAENIVHLVLARLPDAPNGTKGISMFAVPKFLMEPDGSLGARNDVWCASIEHKLGIKASPTCTINFGERDGGALGELVGEPNRGMEYMFVMMNAARFGVGVQGIGLAERAYQRAREFAEERVQGRDLRTLADRSASPVPIVRHPDVRRMLGEMKALTEAMRALAYVTAASLDHAARHPDETVRAQHRAFLELMTPIVKGWCTETGVEIASTALQVFGGMGFVEETGVAQQYRDVRITSIYEGTTGIQALDLVGRKILRDGGATAGRVIREIHDCARALESDADSTLRAIGERLARATSALGTATKSLLAQGDIVEAAAASVPYLKLWGVVAGGWQIARSAQIARARLAEADDAFYRGKIDTALFYCDHVLSRAAWYAESIASRASILETRAATAQAVAR